MRSACQFQPAADHGPLQRGDHGHAAILDAVEHAVPHLGMDQTFGGVRSLSSERSRPGEKWSPMPWITTAPTASGTSEKQSRSARMMPFVQRVALAGRLRPTTSTGPRVSILSGDMSSAAAFPMTVLVLSRIVMFYNYSAESQLACPAQAFPSSWRKPAPIATESDCERDRGPSAVQQMIFGQWVLAFARTTLSKLHGLNIHVVVRRKAGTHTRQQVL